MVLSLRPEIQRYIDEQVKAGHFPNAEAVVEAAIMEMSQDGEEELDDATLAAIQEGRAQIERGEGISFEEVQSQWKKRLGRM